MTDIKTITTKIRKGYLIGPDEAEAIEASVATAPLTAAADEVRAHLMGNRIDTCSIMNARSGRCSEDCKWCSQSAHHSSGIDVYPLVSQEQALKHALDNHSKGVGRFSLVTSGRAMSDSEIDAVCGIYRAIAEKCDIYLCASMGLLTLEQLQKLKDSGVGHYHCNIETAPSYFPSLCTTHTVGDKLRTIEWAKEAGLKICSGGIIGMGETAAQRIEMAFALRDIGVVSIPVNILNPIPGTRLENTPPLSDDEILRAFAMFRLINPAAHIRFAGGRTRMANIQEKALAGGVSAALVGDLLTTVGFSVEQDKTMFEKYGFSC